MVYLALSALASLALLPQVRGQSNVVPMQTRLAYSGNTGMMVSWNTFSQLSNPTVKYGLSPKNLNETAVSNVSVTYNTSTTFNNHVKISGLEPNTVYYYQPQFSNLTSPASFKTGMPAGVDTSYTVAVVVDLGLIGPGGLTTTVGKGAASPLGPNDTTTVQSLQQFSDFDFLWHREYRKKVQGMCCG